MSKSTKRFKEYLEESDNIKHKRLKKESRHNFKEHLKDVMENEDWDALEDELYEESHSNYRR